MKSELTRMNPKVDWYFSKAKSWKEELELLRIIVLECDLNEELKWGCPCYTYGKSNVVLIHAFKNYCALLFFKGVLLRDEKKILIQQTEHVQAARQLRFTNLTEIKKLQATIKSYIIEATEIEKAGLKVEMKQCKELAYPIEFQKQLNQNKALQKAFETLTPGRQRAYNLYFTQAKQNKTRIARIEKCIPLIMRGLGLND